MLTEEFCNKLLEEIIHFENWCKEEKVHVYRPNSMNNVSTWALPVTYN
jgi:hypothetical protein